MASTEREWHSNPGDLYSKEVTVIWVPTVLIHTVHCAPNTSLRAAPENAYNSLRAESTTRGILYSFEQVQLGSVASARRSIQTYNNQRMSDIRYFRVLYKSGPDIRAQRTDLAAGGIITQ